MLTTHIYRPTLNAGVVYARLAGTSTPMQSIGGIEVLELAVEEDTKKQQDYSRPGGGTRGQVKRVTSVNMKATLQDLNPLNLARAVFGSTSAIAAGSASNEAHTVYKGGLIALAHLSPTSVVVTLDAAPIAALGNFEVRPEGIFVYDDAADIDDADDILVSYSYGAYDLIQALTQAAPILEMRYAGVNEAMSGSPSIVDLFRVQLGATKGVGLINDDFAKLEVEGEVLLDPTKTGEGISRFFRAQVQTPA